MLPEHEHVQGDGGSQRLVDLDLQLSVPAPPSIIASRVSFTRTGIHFARKRYRSRALLGKNNDIRLEARGPDISQ